MDRELVDRLRELVAIPSMNPGRARHRGAGYGEEALARHVAEFLRRCGLEVQLCTVAPGRPNVLARLEGREGGQPLLFVAHLDTVPVEGMTIAPFEPQVREGRLTGRGACDNKGSLAAMLTALRRVAEAGGSRSPILFAGTVDEESGYAGIRALAREGLAAGAAFVGEPTALRIVIAHRGALRHALTTTGRSAHSAHPELGVNAIYAMAPLVADLEALAGQIARRPPHPLVGPPTLSVGTIRGGHSVNTVPDRCTVEVDRRLVPGESAEEAEDELRAAVERHGATMERIFHAAPFELPSDATVVGLAREAVQAAGLEPCVVGVAYATEAPEVLAAGVPVVVLGPGDGSKAHSADEWIALDQLEAAERVYRHLMTFG
ncbi:MAG: M20 family metallopeptidase [Candidatus Brocadiia bacterium]